MSYSDTAYYRRKNRQPGYRHIEREEYLIRSYEFARSGEGCNNKLTKAEVIDIRKNVKGQTYKQLALQFGVHVNTIYKIRKGITWNI